MASIDIHEQHGVVTISIAPMVASREVAAALGPDLIATCRDLRERLAPLTAVILRGSADGFWVEVPKTAAEHDALAPVWSRVVTELVALSAPTIALLRGDVIGPAWDMALACDFRVGAANTLICSPELSWGRLPIGGTLQRLTRLSGTAITLDVVLNGRVLTGIEASERGLLHRVAAPGALEMSVSELVEALRQGAPIALAYAKEAATRAAGLNMTEGLRLETDLAALLQTTNDRAEGISAFLQKRHAQYRGQ